MINMSVEYSDEFIEWARGLKKSKRAGRCLEHMLEYGTLTTEQLSEMGYEHPPRAIRDLRDAGVIVNRANVKSSNGRNIAQYTLVAQRSVGRTGRTGIPKKFREQVNASKDNHCGICNGMFEPRELQCDHRVPFEIGGDPDSLQVEEWMPLCASCNRSKSWSCEHCPNWVIRDPETCAGCFWAHPENYSHVETRPERRLNLTFQGTEETSAYDSLVAKAQEDGTNAQSVLIELLGSLAQGRTDR